MRAKTSNSSTMTSILVILGGGGFRSKEGATSLVGRLLVSVQTINLKVQATYNQIESNPNNTTPTTLVRESPADLVLLKPRLADWEEIVVVVVRRPNMVKDELWDLVVQRRYGVTIFCGL